VTGALFGVAWWATVDASAMFEPFEVRLLRFAVYAMFVLVMIVVTFIDLDHQLILDRVTYPSIVVFYGAGLLLGRHWNEGVIGAALGYGLVWLIAEGYFRLTGREGMGLGDGKLLAVVGALLGWRGVVVALFGGSLVGSALGLGALLLARSRPHNVGHGELEVSEEISLTRVEMPFGPYLAIAAMFYLFAEPWVRINVSWLGS
jgi:leader peptidase (prepilin peptidase) / N-methyltransferase